MIRCMSISSKQKEWRENQLIDMKKSWFSLNNKSKALFAKVGDRLEKSLISEKFKKIWPNKKNI